MDINLAEESLNGSMSTWLGLRIKKGTGMGASTELGQSSSAMSARESRKPPPERVHVQVSCVSKIYS